MRILHWSHKQHPFPKLFSIPSHPPTTPSSRTDGCCERFSSRILSLPLSDLQGRTTSPAPASQHQPAWTVQSRRSFVRVWVRGKVKSDFGVRVKNGCRRKTSKKKNAPRRRKSFPGGKFSSPQGSRVPPPGLGTRAWPTLRDGITCGSWWTVPFSAGRRRRRRWGFCVFGPEKWEKK